MKDEMKEASAGSTTKPPDAPPGDSALPPNLLVDKKSPASPSYAELDIEAPTAEDATVSLGSMAERIRARLNLPGADKSAEGKPKPKKKLRTTKREQADLMDAARTLLSPMLIVAVSIPLGEACAPTEDEADSFVEPMARIIARHVPIPDHLSADLVDLLSMSAVGVIWYRRVKDDLPSKGGDDRRPPSDRDDGRPPTGVPARRVDFSMFEPPITEDVRAVSDFLPAESPARRESER